MATVASALQADEQARFWTADPVFDSDVKRNWLAAFMQAKAPKLGALTYNFAVQVAENGRMNELPAIADAYARLMSAERGEVKAEVTTALPLSAAQRERVAASLHRFVMPGQHVELEEKVDESILVRTLSFIMCVLLLTRLSLPLAIATPISLSLYVSLPPPPHRAACS